MTTTETDRPAVGGRGPWGTSRPVFWGSVAVVVLVAGLTIAFPETAGEVIGRIQTDVVSAFGWYYVLLVAGFVAFALWVGLGRWGDITLGQDDDVPQYRLTTWFAMLFATGMGIGMVFWGVAEPLSHYADPKPGVTGTPEELAQAAMSQTYLHWGVSAWAIYVVVGLALAYTVHRKGRPVSIRWALEPLLGARVRGRLGDGIDITAVVGTVFGIATSLGLGVLQITAGLEHVGIARSSTVLQVVVIVGVTGLATFSVVSGLDRGLKWLSNINVVFAGVLLLAVLALGPTLFLLREFVQSLGVYLASVVPMMFNVSAYAGAEGEAWQASWTTFYWGWWISWSPFVGVFIARISRGRTVREFVGGVLLVPTLVCFLWFSVLGGSALYTELFGGGGLVGPGGEVVPENALFDLLAALPGGAVLSVGAIVLVALFFITSADSGALVVSMLSAGGDPGPRTPLRVLWAALGGVLAIALLVAGGLTALQTAAILIALPFSVVMIGMVVSTSRALHAEHTAFLRAEKRQVRAQLAAHVGAHVEARVQASVARHVDERLGREPGVSRPPQPPRPGVRRRRTD
ncbi:BCCT family transporter [Cellulomonas hominis]|uniref:BCCT family transporter n=1 Tax=Cellulomonas hominis TaxID=156981 RepID=UPI0027DFDC58|nr:BCCT family transporter [Cellulomonas hominis]